MAGIAACSALVELYLSHNGIWSLDEQLTQLKALRVRLEFEKRHCIATGYRFLWRSVQAIVGFSS
jgi:ABC-type transport system involved in cytochrome c biogenesis ATPase subunit